MINIKQNGDVYELRFKYDPYLISLVKNVPGRKWDAQGKMWTIPVNNLGWLINEFKDTPYESILNIQSGEQINENASLDATASADIPDIDISDMDHYVEDGSSLFQHQIDFLKYAKNRSGKGFILADEMGCVSGDTVVHCSINGEHCEIALWELHAIFNTSNRDETDVSVMCVDDNTFDSGELFNRYNDVRKVIFSGIKQVYKLTLSDGRYIEATADHEILTDIGYVELQHISTDDKVFALHNEDFYVSAIPIGIDSIVCVGEKPTYDIVMKDPYRNFIANGIVVHNCGKTLEVLNYALYQRKIKNYKHCLIICCVNSAKFSWQEDIYKHTNGKETAYILGTRRRRGGTFNYSTGGKEKLDDLFTGHMYGDKSAPELPYFIITNIESLRMQVGHKYAIAESIVNMIIKREIRLIAIDEVHKNVSPKSAQGKLILQIKKKTGRVAEWIPMTGTPIVNRPTDVFTPLRLVDGHNIKSYWEWCQKFVIYGGFGDHQVMGYKNIPFLKEMLQGNMLRRLKEEVLDLPDKIYYTEYVENTPIQQKLYMDVQDGIYDRKDEILQSANPLAEMLKLRQVNGSPELIDDSIQVDSKYISKNAKLKRILELIDEIVERGEKVVVFSNWVAPLKTLYKFIASKYKTACYTGTMSESDRQKHKHTFINNPDYKIMIGTIGALGTNHTLTVANNVIFYDSPWTHAERNQAIDRCHRISAKSNVNVYTLITKDTIDETVHKILEDKKDISGYIVDGKLDIRNNPELFDKLLGKIK